MTEEREQDRPEERDSTARPVTAAARRERRASARESAPGKAEDQVPAKAKATPTRTRRARATDRVADEVEATQRTAKKGKPTPGRDGRDRRPSLFSRLARFLREVVAELRKVIWPTRKQQVTYTVVVLVFVAFVVALVFGLDTLFAKGVFWVFA